jgi:outer membrane lipase/esterase
MTSLPIKKLAGAAALAITASISVAAQAGPYSALYVFGDSLSDSGNVLAATGGAVPQSQYFLGRLSNGPNYADRLAIGLGVAQSPFGLNPSLAPGSGATFPYGTNYAWGGANSGPYIFPVGGLAGVPPVFRSTLPDPGENPSQLQLYALASGMVADPNALYVVWTGGGDLRDAVNYVQQGNEASAAVIGATAVDSSLSNISGALATLQFMGAKHVLVPNVPDLGRTPETRDWDIGTPLDLSAYATALTTEFNLQLPGVLGAFPGLGVIPFDANAVFNELLASPGIFTNTTDACLSGGANSIYLPGTICASPETWLWWDNHHATATVHSILGERMLAAAVPEPATYALMFAGIGVIAATVRRRKA